MSTSSSKNKVLIIGDVVLDRYRIGGAYHFRAGGVGNVLSLADFAECEIQLVTTFQQRQLLEFLLRSYRPALRLQVFESRGSLNIVDYEMQNGRIIQMNDNPKYRDHNFDEEIAHFIENADFDRIVVSDYGLGTLGPSTKMSLRKVFSQRRADGFVDARHANFSDYFAAAYFFPTFSEFGIFTRSSKISLAELTRFSSFLGAKGVFLKCSEHGLLSLDGERCHYFLGAKESGVVDVYGAGDMLLGGIATRSFDGPFSADFIERVLSLLFERLKFVGGGILSSFTEKIELECLLPHTTCPAAHPDDHAHWKL